MYVPLWCLSSIFLMVILYHWYIMLNLFVRSAKQVRFSAIWMSLLCRASVYQRIGMGKMAEREGEKWGYTRWAPPTPSHSHDHSTWHPTWWLSCAIIQCIWFYQLFLCCISCMFPIGMCLRCVSLLFLNWGACSPIIRIGHQMHKRHKSASRWISRFGPCGYALTCAVSYQFLLCPS